MVTPTPNTNDHYLVSMHGNPISSSRIADVVNSPLGISPIGGNFVVRAPAGAAHNPTDLADLLSQKYGSLLASYPGFQHILYDDMLDASGINLATSEVTAGERSNIAILPGHLDGGWSPGMLRTTTSTLDIAPASAVLVWELFEYAIDDSSGRITRTYRELAEANTFVDAYFNAGNYTRVTNGAIFHIDPAAQGDQFRLIFWNNYWGIGQCKTIWVGSWAVLY